MVVLLVFVHLLLLDGLPAQEDLSTEQILDTTLETDISELITEPSSTKTTVISTTVFTTTVSVPPPGHNPCSWGPSYWCYNKTTEVQCNKTEYCQKVGKDPCTWGPQYWCTNKSTIEECKTEEYCRAHPEDHCKDGPHYWCLTFWSAVQCGFYPLYYCITHAWISSTEQGLGANLDPIVGGNNCTWGPEFWCEDLANAQLCKAVDYCNQHGWKNQPLSGEDKCTWGPAFWCTDVRHAFRCGGFDAFKTCYEGKGFQIHIKDNTGLDRCTWGPAFWCKSGMNGISCGKNAVKYCKEHNWLDEPEDTYNHAHLGSVSDRRVSEDNCTWGPAFWCENVRNSLLCGFATFEYCFFHGGIHSHNKSVAPGSNECKDLAHWVICKEDPYLAVQCGSEVVKFCLDHIWPDDSNTTPGSDACTRGPSYWCKSFYNAVKCNAEKYCGSNVRPPQSKSVLLSNRLSEYIRAAPEILK
ncbi:hypothetical protein ILUMI_27249 [Ignelater luminosus]|uniref:Saposin A-type domain-containing protein n=1 Tax=Ignelater luminosus TaxID=2038154 RepID=A0A8K0FVQ0_IGNLU|nr:hypothetical protein ILUMI_27249 [Ignelater luminosus]